MLAIEKNIPIPKNVATGGFGQPPKYPEFATMEVGDSIFFESNCEANKAASAAHNLHLSRLEHKGKKFRKRALETGGARIWRIA